MLLYFSQILAVFIVGGYALTCDESEYLLETFCCPKCPAGKIQHKFGYKVLLSPQLGGTSFSASHVVIGGDRTMSCTVPSCGC